jgi:hypothetical protein
MSEKVEDAEDTFHRSDYSRAIGGRKWLLQGFGG